MARILGGIIKEIPLTPEQYFRQHGDYIRHYYSVEKEDRDIRLECVKVAQAIVPVGVDAKKVLEYSETFYNYIKNGKKRP